MRRLADRWLLGSLLWLVALLVVPASAPAAVSEFSIPATLSAPLEITSGPDGALWFTDLVRIGRVTTGGSFSLFSVPPAGSFGITAGPDGALWFTEFITSGIGRFTPSGSSSVLP